MLPGNSDPCLYKIDLRMLVSDFSYRERENGMSYKVAVCQLCRLSSGVDTYRMAGFCGSSIGEPDRTRTGFETCVSWMPAAQGNLGPSRTLHSSYYPCLNDLAHGNEWTG